MLQASANGRHFRHCEICGEVVGVYEPLVFVLADKAVCSSIAARPELLALRGCSIAHRACFARRADRRLALRALTDISDARELRDLTELDCRDDLRDFQTG